MPDGESGGPGLLALDPYARDYAFGGVRLGAYGKRIAGRTAETWEFSLYPGRESRLQDSGERLDAYLERAWGLGEAARARLPLVKLLDVQGELPVHCHPGDAQARALGGDDPGKDEAWLVLEAGPDAAVYLGFEEPLTNEDCHRAVADGSLRERMVRFVPKAGDVVMVPHAVAHSARDIVIWEVQERSDRSLLAEAVDLWARPLAPAAVHAQTEGFLGVVRRGPPPPGLHVPAALPERLGSDPLALAGCEHFVMQALAPAGASALPPGAYTVLSGAVGPGGPLGAGATFLVGPGPQRVEPRAAGTRLLRAWRPEPGDEAALRSLGRHFEAL